MHDRWQGCFVRLSGPVAVPSTSRITISFLISWQHDDYSPSHTGETWKIGVPGQRVDQNHNDNKDRHMTEGETTLARTLTRARQRERKIV
jgi:hypothetical protein